MRSPQRIYRETKRDVAETVGSIRAAAEDTRAATHNLVLALAFVTIIAVAALVIGLIK